MSVAIVNDTKDSTIQVVGEKVLDIICAKNEFVVSVFDERFGQYFISTNIGRRSDFLFSSFFRDIMYMGSSSNDSYSCAVLRDGLLNSQGIHVETRLSAYVNISKTNLADSSIEVDVRSTWTFYCYFEGFPTPNLTWYKNEQVVEDSEKFKFMDDGQVLEINNIFLDDEGIYKCKVSNYYSEITKYTSLNMRITNIWLRVQIILLICAAFFIAILTFMKFQKYKKIHKKLKYFGLFYSEKNNLVLIYMVTTILILGKQLGSSAFGVTFQATIVNHFLNDPVKTVAVKTVNPSSGFECIKALVSELKILSHLGSHVNIVNFLGACTRRLVKDELYVALEFCSFGSLLDYIKKNSKNFIDHKDYDSDVFNWGADDAENSDNKISVWAF